MVLNDQVSEWWKVLAGVPQGSLYRPLLFLIFINDAPAKLEYNEISTDDTSLFSLVRDPNESLAKLDRDLGRVVRWAHQWKISFNPDPSKEAVRFIFRRINLEDTPPVYFNNLAVASYLGLLLDKRLAFDMLKK